MNEHGQINVRCRRRCEQTVDPVKVCVLDFVFVEAGALVHKIV